MLGDAQIDNGSAEVFKNTLQINNEIVGLSYSNSKYKWKNVEGLSFGNGVEDPIEEIHSIKLNANVPYPISKKLFLLTSLAVTSTYEKEMDNSYGVNLFSFASYRMTDDHAIQFGGFANYHPTTTLVMPVVSYSYRASAKDGYKLILGFPRSFISYVVSDDLILRSGYIYSQTLARLSNNSLIQKSGFMESKDSLLNFGVNYKIMEKLELQTDVVYGLKREVVFYDSSAREIAVNDFEKGFGGIIKLVYRF